MDAGTRNLRQVFSAMDTDADGHVSIDEFLHYIFASKSEATNLRAKAGATPVECAKDILRCGDIRLVKGLTMQKRKGAVMRHQDIPLSDFVPKKDAASLLSELMGIIVLSYGWLSRDHPDPQGFSIGVIWNLSDLGSLASNCCGLLCFVGAFMMSSRRRRIAPQNTATRSALAIGGSAVRKCWHESNASVWHGSTCETAFVHYGWHSGRGRACLDLVCSTTRLLPKKQFQNDMRPNHALQRGRVQTRCGLEAWYTQTNTFKSGNHVNCFCYCRKSCRIRQQSFPPCSRIFGVSEVPN